MVKLTHAPGVVLASRDLDEEGVPQRRNHWLGIFFFLVEIQAAREDLGYVS